MRTRRIILSALIVLLAAVAQTGPARAQAFTSARVVKARGYLSFDKVPPGSVFRLAVELQISDGYHVNAHKPTLDYLIPTNLDLAEARTDPGFTLSEPIYPDHIERAFSFTDGVKLRVYEGRALVGVEGTAGKDLAPSIRTLKGTVTVQACNDNSCLAPAKLPVEIAVPIADRGDAITAMHPEIFSAIRFQGSAFPTQPAPSGGQGAGAAGAAEDTVGRWVVQRGWFAAVALIFLGGLALNLTPCVYPLIPITLAYFGGQASGKPARTFGLASIYVLGMCVTYSTLGVVAATTGSILGSWLQSPVALLFVALVMLALGFSMLGFYELQVPEAIRRRITSKPGPGGALFMGLTVGLVAAPCIGPFVVSLLAYVGRSGSPLLGFSLFFLLALGLGLPYLVLGGVAGAASGLPRAGAWMVWFERLFGCILLAMASYFINPLLPDALARFTIPILLLGSGVYLGFMEGSPIRALGFRLTRYATAAACVAIAAWLLMPSSADAGMQWEPYGDEALGSAIASARPVIIDFTADWCLPCKELDHQTFANPEVVSASARFVRLKVDITGVSSDQVQALLKKYEVLGAPTLLFIGSDGLEHRELRLTGFEDAAGFLERMKQIN
ncbi:MAG TPA: cytochrome c biogenesis protein CcdA [Candidatus Polarisedimenticolia bacterium]